ncbi:MAG: prolyl oligopeptidase family serine peptidase [Planctomycetaceae bacterium]|nr:prolyl oligopeptidase family serine peptidase [Planctomycetaceae bacterium]
MPTETFIIEGRDAFVIPPTNWSATRATPWVWYAPTLKGLPGPEEQWMIDQFGKAGIAVAGIDVGESYGSPAGRTLYSALYKELTRGPGFSKKPCLLGRSRGGLMLYNWAAENPDCVGAIAGIYPVCNLASWPGLDKACGAYALTEKQLAAALKAHNPIDRLAPLAAAGVPLFHIHGDVDELVPLEANSGELAQRYQKLGGLVKLLIPKGQGHNMWQGFFQCQDLVNFVIAHAA